VCDRKLITSDVYDNGNYLSKSASASYVNVMDAYAYTPFNSFDICLIKVFVKVATIKIHPIDFQAPP